MKKTISIFLSLFIAGSTSFMGAEQMLNGQYTQNVHVRQPNIKDASREFNALFPGPYSLTETELETTREKKIPQLMSSGEVLNSNAKIPAFALKNNAFVAVLVKNDKEFIIVSSNLKKSNDLSVEGLKLDHENPAYKNLTEDLGFNGKVNLWGKEYQIKVDPLKNKKGQVIGAFLVGLPVANEEISPK